MQNKIVVLLKTHVWNDDLEKFATKIYNEATLSNVDFFILMHDETNSLTVQNDILKKVIIKFTEADIKNIYQVGFYSMWLSNHWILMYFYQKYKDIYQYFWSIEYDVRISGDSSQIWKHNSNCDFLYVRGNYLNQNNYYRNHYVGDKLASHQKYYGFLQLARYSNVALAYLNDCYVGGENGQDELITFSLLNRGKFTGSKTYLQSLIKGTWTWESKYVDYNKKIYNKHELNPDPNGSVYIFHPVK